MTDQELEQIESRAREARAALQRIDRLSDAVKRLEEKDLIAVSIPVSGGELAFSRGLVDGKPSFTKVCWANLEEGLQHELLQAVAQVLRRRLKDAQNAFADV